MSDLLPCPLCGESEGYKLSRGETYRWWVVSCAACGEGGYECPSDRRTDADTALPKQWAHADATWNEVSAHAHKLRTDLVAAKAEIERLRAEAFDLQAEMDGEIQSAKVHIDAYLESNERLREENQKMRDTFAAIKEHCEPQPSPLAKLVALTRSRYLMKPEDV